MPSCPFSQAALNSAWRRVRANRGAPGFDRQTIAVFANDDRRNIERLAEELNSGRYTPGRLRRVEIAKPDGRLRRLDIPNVRDRIAQTAVSVHLCDRLDRTMSPSSFGYRPGRGVRQALSRARQALREQPWCLDADINDFFARAPHAPILAALAPVLSTRGLAVVAGWLAGFGRERGLAQGSPLSPLLSNIVLDHLDTAMTRGPSGYVRYADDFVATAETRREAHLVRSAAEVALSGLGLEFNLAKTSVRQPGEAFVFLGEILVSRRRWFSAWRT